MTMNWKYILSLSIDDLSDEEKDHLYGILAWYNYDEEKLDHRKYVTVLKISQEIMKHKAEQVESLLAELDEVAVRQGEDEARKQESQEEVLSLKSKKSSTSDYDDLERKYKETRSKLKQQLKANDRLKLELQKLANSVETINQEKMQLQSELHAAIQHGDDSRSDISESLAEQHKELVNAVHHKNKQISDLLNDIEKIETENVTFREQISNLRDQLADATVQISNMTDDFTTLKLKYDDQLEQVLSVEKENQLVEERLEKVAEEKRRKDKEFEELSADLNATIKEYKIELQLKNEEIQQLKSSQLPISSPSPELSTTGSDDKLYISALNKALVEREDQLMEVQKRLQSAVEEMEESTHMIKHLSGEKSSYKRKSVELAVMVKDLKAQLKEAHERSQGLQEAVRHVDRVVEEKTKDYNELLDQLRSDGSVEIANSLEELQSLKATVSSKDKEVSDLIRTTNKLQGLVNQVDNENSALREKLGIKDDDEIITNTNFPLRRKQGKELRKLQKQVKLQEENELNLRMEIQKLNRVASVLANQILELGDTPEADLDELKDVARRQMPDEEERRLDASGSESVSLEKYSGVVEENEALRKGLHEILESIHLKDESSSREIKSSTLEKLLKSLDVRHLSGWYHPAMRLQAELHSLQGVNAELRQQYKLVRSELGKLQKSGTNTLDGLHLTEITSEILETLPAPAAQIISNLNNHLLGVLSSYRETDSTNTELKQKLEECNKESKSLEEQLTSLNTQYQSHKENWEVSLQKHEEEKRDLEEKAEISVAKLNEYLNFKDDCKSAQHVAEMAGNLVKLNRKCLFLEDRDNKLTEEIKKLKNCLVNSEVASKSVTTKLHTDTEILTHKLNLIQSLQSGLVDKQILIQVQSDLDSITVKYRSALKSYESLKTDYSNELSVLKLNNENLQQQNRELHNQLLEIPKEITSEVVEGQTNITRKLAECQINELTEKQRANHMNNLYVLVKEQFEKSENRFQELEKFNKDILCKNLDLQEAVKDLEDKVINCINVQAYKELETKYLKTSEDLQKVVVVKSDLEQQLREAKSELGLSDNVTSSNIEVLSLKHQILDLQSESDEKALIAKLGTDVVYARIAENETRKQLESISEDLKEYQERFENCKTALEQSQTNHQEATIKFQEKLSNLETIIRHQRKQYLGSIPIVVEESMNSNLQQVLKDKQKALASLRNAQKNEAGSVVLKEQLTKELQLANEYKETLGLGLEEAVSKISRWHKERSVLQVKELKYLRESEFRDLQLQQLTDRLNMQDELITRLQEEVLYCYQHNETTETKPKIKPRKSLPTDTKPVAAARKPTKNRETQTVEPQPESTNVIDAQPSDVIVEVEPDTATRDLNIQLKGAFDQLNSKELVVQQLCTKVADLEASLSLLRTQMGDKMSQILFYEKHIMDLQGKIKKLTAETNSDPEVRVADDGQALGEPDNLIVMKSTIEQLQHTLTEKDESIIQYETLLKKDRDEHSLAAARMQEEVKRLQEIIAAKEELNETPVEPQPDKPTAEEYIMQVHLLEEQNSQLDADVASLNAQLQTSKQEVVRWKDMANNRLEDIESLRKTLEENYVEQINAYKQDSERWKEEISTVHNLMNKYRKDVEDLESDIQKKLKEKDDRIHELLVTIRQTKNEAKRQIDRSHQSITPKLSELESSNEQIMKEYEGLKKRHERLVGQEKNARDEIRLLREKVLKRPVASKTGITDKSLNDQQKKKIIVLEKEVEELKQKLEKEAAYNETHKMAVADHFEKWKQQKQWQQQNDKLKSKLQEKTGEFDKLSHTCFGYRALIERLEREKHNLEVKIKTLKGTNNIVIDSNRMEMLDLENEKLRVEMEALMSKLQMQQHHSGGLGAAMLQEKLEAQERKIAILELASKGTGELRAEFERLQNSNSGLQKVNLRLEAENLELKLDLEKYTQEEPHLKEQIRHLETYIEALKTETEIQHQHQVTESGDHQPPPATDSKKISELERTVFVLKRVVEKLQVENKRLVGGSRPCSALSDHSIANEKLKIEHQRLKDQYVESMHKVTKVRQELVSANNKIKSLENQVSCPELPNVRSELARVKKESDHKSQLLDKIKNLLQRAAVKEKALIEEVASLRTMIPTQLPSDVPSSTSMSD